MADAAPGGGGGGGGAHAADCRMYEPRYPEVDDVVMVQVQSIEEMGAYVSLLEYAGAEGMILLSELSRRRIRSVNKLIKVGRVEPVMVLRVDREKGYIDLSKRRVSPEDVAAAEERFGKSKLVHSILRHVSETTGEDLEQLYRQVGWPLYRLHGHALDAFRAMVADDGEAAFAKLAEIKANPTPAPVPASAADDPAAAAAAAAEAAAAAAATKAAPSVLTPAVREALMKNVRRRLTPQPVKVRADVEMTNFSYDGVEKIRAAMRAAEAASTEDCPVKMVLVAPPLYVLTTQTLDKAKGVEVLTAACDAAAASIAASKGRLAVKEGARAVSEREDRLLAERLEALEAANAEVDGDADGTDSDEEGKGGSEDEGMGDIDLDKPALAV
jgi:translation initiation factor 2 subunit 1